MTALVKATLADVSGTGWGTVDESTKVDVQFNPTSLRVQISNKAPGGQQAGSQNRQRPGTGETTVSFDLVFDSADQGTTDAPVPVTKKTELVEKYVRPQGSEQHQEAPPRVEFKWGTFVVHGVMESASVELDFWSANGTPLRAKVSVSIKGQDPRYEYPAEGPGDGKPPPGPNDEPSGAPGTSGSKAKPAKVASALAGESLAGFSARVGLDPAAWRALSVGISDPLRLSAGLEIGIPGGGSGGLGIRGSAGTSSPRDAVASLPLPGALPRPSGAAPSTQPSGIAEHASGGLAPRAPTGNAAGKAIAQSGGVSRSIDGMRAAAQENARTASRRGFGVPARPAAPGPHRLPERPPANAVFAESADPRAFGGAVPLRPRRGGAGSAPHTVNPTVPGWEALRTSAPSHARRLGGERPNDPCACAGTKVKPRRG